ncbi:MAG: glutamine--fructose-6-phosphate transaminase (isomerizing) [Candidatus Nomurabacteria bacterium]|jgi:glucosamine--fructose-6-phosphate aminotransferase (isomerizing)|nr:glutamine--fructose-6-phosphate transaminase (isomerizing) [Candidatus Nomurabacteria bacterium]
MCGIVGYIGEKNAQDYLVSGLKRLEYRGYDSAGMVTFGTKPTLLRAKGKITELEKLVKSSKRNDRVGIGHTRWATHGEPSVKNAHPHQAGDIYLVHNGIIENYKELKAKLTNHKFVSDTDSEVLAALIESFYDKNTALVDAVMQALQLVAGTYGIAVASTREPDKIIVARLGSPLIIGVGTNETLVASDASALLGHTKNAIYLNDGEIGVITTNSVDLYDLDNHPITPKVETIMTDLVAIQKQGYDHFLLKEIMEQPRSLTETLRGRIDPHQKTVKLGGINMSPVDLRNIRHIVIVGCGTAYYAGLLASYYISQIVEDVTVEAVIASEFRYKSSYLPKNSVALIVSQSGETADTLACMREIKARGVRTLGVINTVGSTIAREVDGGVYVHAGPEISVASTKAFTSQTVAMLMFGIMIAQAKSLNPRDTVAYVDELLLLPDEIEKLLKKYRTDVEKLAKKYAGYEHAIYLGRDTAYPAALEGALKLKEVSYIDANGYPAGELKHGPISLVSDDFFLVFNILDGSLFDKAISNLTEVNSRGGHTIVITNSNKKIDAEVVFKIDTELRLLAPILCNVVQQLLAYYVSVVRGNDVDQPRNLAKSVTVE